MASAARDEGLGNLEAFLALLQVTRGSLGELEAGLDESAADLNDGATRLLSRSDAFSHALSSLASGIGAAQQETAADLGTLGQAALAAAEGRLTALRGGLQVALGALKVGVTKAQDQLDTGSVEVENALARSTEAADGLQAHLLDLGAQAEEAALSAEVEITTAAAALEQAASQTQATLDAVSTFLSEGLAQYASAAFDSLAACLETEVEPALTEVLDDLARSVLGLFERLDAAVETSGDDLIATGEEVLTEASRSLGELLRAREREETRTQDEMTAFLEENQRCLNGMEKGGDTVAALGPLSSQLAAAREVAERVQEMMDMFNPFQ
jgi:hypothetical protein